MHQVGHKEIGIEILGGLEKRKCGISQDSAVLPYEAKRKLFVVLIIPLGTDDMVVHAAKRCKTIVQAEEDIAVVDAQRFTGTHGQHRIHCGASGKKWGLAIR